MSATNPLAYRSSSILKMVGEAPEKRKIRKFPSAYHPECTPYLKIEFSPQTREVLEENRPVVSNLRICKVILLGDVCVGKTCIVNRFCHQIFDTNYKATIGVDFDVEKFEIVGFPFTLQIWDTAGQERFKSIAQSYYRKAHVIILVFDLTNISSLRNCKTWLREALDVSESNPFRFLIGTKRDLISDASYKVVENYATKFASSINAEYWPCSSKTNENIEEIFNRVAALTFDHCIQKECEKRTKNVEIGAIISLKSTRNENNGSKRRRRPSCNGKCV